LERQAISSVLDAALAGTGGSVALWGEAGLGKSRLADWALEEWASKGGAIAKGRCLEFNEPVPYQPLLDALSRYISAEELGAFLDRDNARAVLVGDFSGGAEASAIDQSGRDVGRLRLLSWLRGRLQAITQHQPLLLALEDLQWADSGTIDFVTYVLEHAPRMRLAVLLTSRLSSSRQAHESQVRRLARAASLVCTLQPLDESDTAGLVELLIGRSVSSKKLLSWIYRETEGHPLFVVETIRLLQQREVAGGLGTQSSSTRPLASEHLMPVIPHGVRATIEHRLSLLPSDSSKVVDLASVVGRVLEVDVLRAMTRMSENRLSRAVAELVRVGVLEREGSKLRFAHDKIREICYERLPARARRAYHAKCADLLAESTEATAPALAWHQQSSGQWHLATKSWTHAGDHARDVRAYHDARRAYESALACLKQDRTLSAGPRIEGEFDLLLRFEETLAIIGSPEERRTILRRMGVLVKGDLPNSKSVAYLVRRAILEDHVGHYAEAADLARQVAVAAAASGDSGLEIAGLRLLASTLSRGGRSRRAVAVARLALRKLGADASPMRALILGETAVAYMKLAAYGVARRMIDEAKECTRMLGHEDADPLICTTSAVVLKWTGELRTARADAWTAARIYHRDGDAVAEARAVFQLATLDALEGNLAASLRHLRQAKAVLRTAGYLRIYAACLNEVAHGIGRQLGNYEWAWHASRLALNLPQEHRNPYTTAIYLDSQAQLLMDQNRLDEAAETMRVVFDLLAQGPASTMQHLESQARRGAVLFRQGRHSEAIVDLETAASAQTRSGAIIFLPTTLSYLALARGEVGDRDGALEASNEALRVLEQINLANHQPQQIFWHHFLVLTKFDQEPRLQFLVRAVELIERQASTLSPAQGRRLRRDVLLNREILEAWAASGHAAAGASAHAGRQAVEAPTRDVA
jgi:tetratricopeptide (TPR) repeat protein